jgi:hypothetical protein
MEERLAKGTVSATHHVLPARDITKISCPILYQLYFMPNTLQNIL